MIRPRGKLLLVELVPVDYSALMGDNLKALGVVAVDKSKHYQHKTRKGKVIAVGPDVREVAVGDVVVFEGADGRTEDYDPERQTGRDERTHRWLSEKECLAVEVAA